MKKVIIPILAAGLAFASCTNEELPAPATGEGVVTFTATLPSSLASRAYSDGTTATKLQYAIYESGAAEITPLIEDVATFVDLRTTVNATLATGKTYDILFWAQAPQGSPYTFDATTRTVTADYTGVLANDETLDAFFWAEKDLAVNGPVNKTVTLRRPFAQLNIGTTDMDVAKAAGLEVTKTTVTVAVSSTLDLYEGTVGEAEELTFALNAIPAATEVFPVDGCAYLAMNYLLVGADKQLVDVTFGHDASAATTTFPGVPVQRNYRTNIYGALLTNPAIFEVVIDKEFEDEHEYYVGPWDGTTVKLPAIDEEAKTVTVTGAAELQGLAQLVNGTEGTAANNFEGYTVTLTSDIDFGGHEITPIAAGSKRVGSEAVGNAFKGVLDGGGFTVKNFKVTDESADANAGFIANLTGEGAELRNITFANVTMSAPNCEQVAVVAMLTGGAKVTNVHVESGSISGKQGVGAIVGRLMKDGTIEGCSNAAAVSCTTNNVGGIVGAAYYTAVGKTMTISNCSNSGKVHGNNVSVGGIAGLCAADVTGCTNTGTISANNNSAGGIVGQQNARGVLTACVNKGNVLGNESKSLGFGGIIGWIKYDITTSYPNHSVIAIDACENYGEIIAANANGVSGIVGLTYRHATITGCKNYSENITAGQMAAGITVYQNIANQLPDTDPMLTVTGCLSTTNTETQITAGLKDALVYDNTHGTCTTLDNNTYQPR